MAEYNFKARPTTYKGIQMRSRLEAQFAQWLDNIGVKWEYEPRCFADERGQYLPDFYLPKWREYVEVKPTVEHAVGALERMHVILSSVPDAEMTVYVPDGESGFVGTDDCTPWFHRSRRRVGLEPVGTCRCNRERGTRTIRDAILNHSGYDDHMHCLVCGDEYTHLEDVRIYDGGSDGGRYTAALEFRCEQSCTFAVEIHNHKGYTQLMRVPSQLPPYVEDDPDDDTFTA